MQAKLSSNVQIGFEAAGYSRPLVFLHAFPLDASMWREQMWEFSRDCYVVTPDARGIGESSPFEAEPSIETLARDVNSLLDYLKITEPIALCGLSMGGYAAMEFARLFPHRLCALVLADTRAEADSDEAKANREKMIALAQNEGAEAVARQMLPNLLADGANSPHAETLLNIARKHDGAAIANLLRALRDRRDSSEILANLQVPTLLITGSQDAVTSPEVMAQMAALMPNARHEIIDDAGHLPNLEKPREFNAFVREFLKQP